MQLSEGLEILLSSVGNKPLELWSKTISLDGKIKRINDENLNNNKVIEIIGKTDTSTNKDSISTCISCPALSTDFLQTNLPIIVFVIKNLKLDGKIEFQVIDHMNLRRKFILITNSTREKIPKILPTMSYFPFNLEEGWNHLEIDLRLLTKDIYSTNYTTLNRIIVYPNFRIRRIYLQDRHYEKYEKPQDFFKALIELSDLRKNHIKLIDKNCQTNTQKTTTIVPKIIKKKRVKKKIEVTK
ncbi:hypothetical protein HCN44_002137 [Aphidius gifuensis]|uniref:CFA20 domain-containing protein n=1 Tax=Aphidius gifuensis TaxID=684658 RepID=A0A834Y223_APHGI|nr:cilia- and flagella-associated protein 20-like [Aphidius gifuensis]KAF7996505.1 hypothetical protein HCN44_002137 [Aphidius gifuensis]